MKKALLLFAVGFATHSLQAQVGINTTDPEATLDVVSKDSDTKSFRVKGTPNKESMTVLNNGNIGLGVEDPSTKLEVTGDIRHNFRAFNNNDQLIPSIFQINANDGDGNHSINWNTSGSLTPVYVTQSPAYRLVYNRFNSTRGLHLLSAVIGDAGEAINWDTSMYWSPIGSVGIGTNRPAATLDIKKRENLEPTQPQGVIFPNFSTEERSKFENTVKGTMIYNTDKECIEMYRGVVGGVHQWTCLPDAGSAQAQSVAVTPQGFEGNYVGGIAFNGSQKVKFKLENNSFSKINSVFGDAVSIQNGAAGITVTECKYQKLSGGTPTGNVMNCSSGAIQLLSGESVLLKYKLSGTPETGTLKADFNKLGAQADQSIAVGLGSATIKSPKEEYIVSLIYTGTTPATEIQGELTSGMVVKIPYEGGSGSYNAVTSASVTTAPGVGGDTNNLSLSIPSGNFGVNGFLEATISVDGDGTYLVEKQAPGDKYEIATIPYTLNGNNYEVKLIGIGGIPDKKFGEADGAHNFLYLPVEVTAPNGYNRTWLNMNLGAEAAKVGSPNFNPTMTKYGATGAHRDKTLYGSLYQWQRPTDGHEFRNSPTTDILADNWQATSPPDIVGKFISSGTNNRWKSGNASETGANVQLWQSETFNNPCPSGYHVPTREEWSEFIDVANAHANGNIDRAVWRQNYIPNLSAAGLRMVGMGVLTSGGEGYYWTSTPRPVQQHIEAYHLHFYNSNSGLGQSYSPPVGASVRCIKD